MFAEPVTILFILFVLLLKILLPISLFIMGLLGTTARRISFICAGYALFVVFMIASVPQSPYSNTGKVKMVEAIVLGGSLLLYFTGRAIRAALKR